MCSHADQAQIDAELVAEVPLRELAKRYGMSMMALSRHRSAHLSAAIVSLHKASPSKTGQSFVARMEALMVRTEALLVKAETKGQGAQALNAVRELGRLLELWGKATGELNERPQVTVNLQTTQEWVDIRTVILEVLAPHPDLRMQVADRLQLLEAAG